MIGREENRLQFHKEKFGVHIRKINFAKRAVKHWNRLLREVVESSSLEVFKRLANVALTNLV